MLKTLMMQTLSFSEPIQGMAGGSLCFPEEMSRHPSFIKNFKLFSSVYYQHASKQKIALGHVLAFCEIRSKLPKALCRVFLCLDVQILEKHLTFPHFLFEDDFVKTRSSLEKKGTPPDEVRQGKNEG